MRILVPARLPRRRGIAGVRPAQVGFRTSGGGGIPGRHLFARPGLIAGPHDDVGRLAGMRYRPLADTVRDPWGWLVRDAAARARPVGDLALRAGIGLDPARERGILARL